jgi:hypothetical protein
VAFVSSPRLGATKKDVRPELGFQNKSRRPGIGQLSINRPAHIRSEPGNSSERERVKMQSATEKVPNHDRTHRRHHRACPGDLDQQGTGYAKRVLLKRCALSIEMAGTNPGHDDSV